MKHLYLVLLVVNVKAESIGWVRRVPGPRTLRISERRSGEVPVVRVAQSVLRNVRLRAPRTGAVYCDIRVPHLVAMLGQ
jgi:hypothetical protein